MVLFVVMVFLNNAESIINNVRDSSYFSSSEAILKSSSDITNHSCISISCSYAVTNKMNKKTLSIIQIIKTYLIFKIFWYVLCNGRMEWFFRLQLFIYNFYEQLKRQSLKRRLWHNFKLLKKLLPSRFTRLGT